MKAPDKIYRSYFYDSASEVFQSTPAEDADTCTEYLRKGALIEWAKEEQMKSTTILADDWWQKVIDKLKSM